MPFKTHNTSYKFFHQFNFHSVCICAHFRINFRSEEFPNWCTLTFCRTVRAARGGVVVENEVSCRCHYNYVTVFWAHTSCSEPREHGVKGEDVKVKALEFTRLPERRDLVPSVKILFSGEIRLLQCVVVTPAFTI